jgi:DNA primase
MPASDWTRSRKPSNRNGRTDANTIPIGVIVSHYGGEVKEGRASSVRCVMHDDSRKSAVINTVENLYFCHTCGKGGNTINVVMEKESLGFKDALARAIEIVSAGGFALPGGSKRRNRNLSKRTWHI